MKRAYSSATSFKGSHKTPFCFGRNKEAGACGYLRGNRRCDIMPLMMQQIFRHITVDPAVRFGKPVIAGTRIQVDLMVGKIADGMTAEMVAQEYDLTREQVRAALQYAAHLVAEEELIFA